MSNPPKPLSDLAAALVRHVEDSARGFGVPGYAVVALSRGMSYVKCGGVSSLDAGGEVGPRTAFNIASCSKAFTSALAGREVAAGRLDWETRIDQILPEFDLGERWYTGQVTIRDLCSNRIGLSKSGITGFGARPQMTVFDLFDRVRHVRQEREFRTEYQYFNLGHSAAAAALGRIDGGDFLASLARQIFRPLGMEGATGGIAASAHRSRLASGHMVVDGAVADIGLATHEQYIGAGQLWLAASDLIPWLRCQLAMEPELSLAGLRPEDIAEMQRAHIVATPRGDDIAGVVSTEGLKAYCLGWQTIVDKGLRIVRHAGGDFGYASNIILVPQFGIGVAVLCNLFSYFPMNVSEDIVAWLTGADLQRRETVALGSEFPTPDAVYPAIVSSARGALTPGIYRHPENGLLRIEESGSDVRLMFDDAPTYNSTVVRDEAGRLLARPLYSPVFTFRGGENPWSVDVSDAEAVRFSPLGEFRANSEDGNNAI